MKQPIETKTTKCLKCGGDYFTCPCTKTTAMKTAYVGNQLFRDLKVETNTGMSGEVQLSMLGGGVIGCVLVYDQKPEKCLGYIEYEDKNVRN